MSEALSEKTCTPCKGGIPPLEIDKAKEMLEEETPDWSLTENGTWLRRTFKFDNFRQALDFAARVGEVAEDQNHHPDVKFGWGYCTVELQTHKIKGLHENDFIMAARIDELMKG